MIEKDELDIDTQIEDILFEMSTTDPKDVQKLFGLQMKLQALKEKKYQKMPPPPIFAAVGSSTKVYVTHVIYTEKKIFILMDNLEFYILDWNGKIITINKLER